MLAGVVQDPWINGSGAEPEVTPIGLASAHSGIRAGMGPRPADETLRLGLYRRDPATGAEFAGANAVVNDVTGFRLRAGDHDQLTALLTDLAIRRNVN
jgi:hypothetical protein